MYKQEKFFLLEYNIKFIHLIFVLKKTVFVFSEKNVNLNKAFYKINIEVIIFLLSKNNYLEIIKKNVLFITNKISLVNIKFNKEKNFIKNFLNLFLLKINFIFFKKIFLNELNEIENEIFEKVDIFLFKDNFYFTNYSYNYINLKILKRKNKKNILRTYLNFKIIYLINCNNLLKVISKNINLFYLKNFCNCVFDKINFNYNIFIAKYYFIIFKNNFKNIFFCNKFSILKFKIIKNFLFISNIKKKKKKIKLKLTIKFGNDKIFFLNYKEFINLIKNYKNYILIYYNNNNIIFTDYNVNYIKNESTISIVKF